ncbi:uncharacterized protein C8R40DRAFT_238613 [Lentinula edodes]|uniref:uncharacterized protein n=1 Tax=Lentinula edodes TaxID=5353 RepID=UPI001E8CF06C|nr:uncharacterized protein C8R40DRAFT_238613 [Lentinula edodes]KAH7874973.1 hypothetical protein C8R40DRAFT_238613 [Lentinula edodes]
MRILDSDEESRVQNEVPSSITPKFVDQIVKGININVNADFPLSRFHPPSISIIYLGTSSCNIADLQIGDTIHNRADDPRCGGTQRTTKDEKRSIMMLYALKLVP